MQKKVENYIVKKRGIRIKDIPYGPFYFMEGKERVRHEWIIEFVEWRILAYFSDLLDMFYMLKIFELWLRAKRYNNII